LYSGQAIVLQEKLFQLLGVCRYSVFLFEVCVIDRQPVVAEIDYGYFGTRLAYPLGCELNQLLVV